MAKPRQVHLAWDLKVMDYAFRQVLGIHAPRQQTTRTYCGSRVPAYLTTGDLHEAECSKCIDLRAKEIADLHAILDVWRPAEPGAGV